MKDNFVALKLLVCYFYYFVYFCGLFIRYLPIQTRQHTR